MEIPAISAHQTPKHRQALLNRGMPLKAFVTWVERAASHPFLFSSRALIFLLKNFVSQGDMLSFPCKPDAEHASSLVADVQEASMQAILLSAGL